MAPPTKVLSSPSAPKHKKITINFTPPPSLPPNYESDTWKTLHEAINAIHQKKAVSSSREELYNHVKNLCSNQKAATLFDRLRKTLREHISSLLPLIANDPDSPSLLERMSSSWVTFCEQMKMICSIFLYLDRTYVLGECTPRSLWGLGLALFQQSFIECNLCDRVLSGVLDLIQGERRGDAVSRSLTQTLVTMLIDLDLYSNVFEAKFLETSKAFYQTEGEEKMEELSVIDYLLHIDRRLDQETERVNYYLDLATKKPLLHTVQRELIGRHTDEILRKGFDDLVAKNKRVELKRLYSLFSLVSSLPKIKAKLKEYIRVTGLGIVTDPEKDDAMVQSLLEMKIKLDGIVGHCFGGDEEMKYSLKEGFESFMSSRENKPAELIARFVDSKLKLGGNKGTSESELEGLLDQVIALFRYINGKDVFEAHYKKDLSKRLLLGRTCSLDGEKMMISKLRMECGSGFTSKLEAMFKDMELSKDIMASFKQSRVSGSISLDFTAHILTMGMWPPYPSVDVTLPPFMSEILEIFKKFYIDKHSGRRLTWQNFLGTCLVKAAFKKGRKDLQLSLFQTLVMLLFNTNDTLTFLQIKEKTNIEDKELRRTLQSLACGKTKVLTKNPKTREVGDSDIFGFNEDFTHQMMRLKIQNIQVKETKKEREKTNESVAQERQYQVDAAVVRIMKTRKTLEHNNLMTEVFNQMKFPIQAIVIKKRIESLIEREYMERDSEDGLIYKYIA